MKSIHKKKITFTVKDLDTHDICMSHSIIKAQYDLL